MLGCFALVESADSLGFVFLPLNSALIVGRFIVDTMEKEFVSKNYICPILNRPTSVDETGFHQKAWLLVRCQETGFVFLSDPPYYSRLESVFCLRKDINRRKETR